MNSFEIMRMAQALGEQQSVEASRPSYVPTTMRPPDRTSDLIAASLAGGMIAAGGKPVTAEEAVGVFREVREAMG